MDLIPLASPGLVGGAASSVRFRTRPGRTSGQRRRTPGRGNRRSAMEGCGGDVASSESLQRGQLRSTAFCCQELVEAPCLAYTSSGGAGLHPGPVERMLLAVVNSQPTSWRRRIMTRRVQTPGMIGRAGALTSSSLLILGILLGSSLAEAQNYSVLYSFQSEPDDGVGPTSSLISDPTGNLYGH